MNIPKINLVNGNKSAMDSIIEASKKKTTISEQTLMANYYAYLHSKSKSDSADFAKIILAK